MQVGHYANAGTARTYGLHLGVAAEPIRNLTLTGGLCLLDAVQPEIRRVTGGGELQIRDPSGNLLDERRIAGAELGSGLSGEGVYPMPPRTYGITLGVKF